MFSNYSHDHIALDTMNIMANGKYIDRIMTKIQNLTSRQATLSVNSASWGLFGGNLELQGAPKGVQEGSWEHFGGFESVSEAIRCNMQKHSNLF